jgi:hypothetical protein
MFIDSIPKELANKPWTEVSNPCLEIDKGPDASYLMVPILGINTLLILYYRSVVVKGELFIEIENYEGTRSASQFSISNLKSTEARGDMMTGDVRLEFKDGTAHQFNFTDKGCAEDFLQNIKDHLLKER